LLVSVSGQWFSVLGSLFFVLGSLFSGLCLGVFTVQIKEANHDRKEANQKPGSKIKAQRSKINEQLTTDH
jgi:hypothetical protein